MGALKIFGVTVGGLSLTGVGAAYSYRQNLITQRRMDLEKEREKLRREQQDVEREVQKEKAEQKKREVVIEKRHDIVHNLWADRFDRYVTGGINLQGYVEVLGEGLGLQKALYHHYDHMSKNMQPFPRFDFSVSHIHNFQILLSSAICQGLHKVVAHMSAMLNSEPMIKSICEMHARQHAVLIPPLEGEGDEQQALETEPELRAKNLGELSRTFAFCVLELEAAITDATEIRQVIANQVPSFIGEGSRDHGIVMNGTQAFLNSLRVNPDKESPIVANFKKRAKIGTVKDEAEAKKAAANNLNGVQVSDETAGAFQEEAVLLNNINDIKSAMKHVETVAGSFDEKDNKWLLEFADSKKTITEAKMRDASLRVKVALEQLQTWKKSATLYLIEQQHLDALKAYEICLAHTMCYIDHEVGKQRKSSE